MGAITFFTFLFLSLNYYTQAGRYSKCTIESIKDSEWSSNYKFKVPINDTFRGEVALYKTENVLRVKFSDQKYLNATWENQILRFFTADNFDTFEQNTDYKNEPSISINLKFDCIQDGSEEMTFTLPVLDVNNHNPVLNERSYEYSFGMTIPKDFKLTEIMPIYSTDLDVTNDKVFFTIDENENFKINSEGNRNGKKFSTELTVLNEIEAPFSQEFTLIATDYGHPARTSMASLIINVYDPKDLNLNDKKDGAEEKTSHPPIFGKHLYYADYNSTNHQLKLKEPIMIKYGAQSNTILMQTGYEKYFNVRFEDSTHQRITVDEARPLPNETLKTIDFITIEIEAINEELQHMPGRTAILIRLPGGANNDNSDENSENDNGSSKDCEMVIFGYSVNDYVIPMVLFLLTVFSIVFINIYVIIMFVNKQKVRAISA